MSDVPTWLEGLNGWFAIPLQVVGFWIAIQQIIKTKRAAVAAREAAVHASDQISTNLLLVVLPQLIQIESDLEWAVSRSDREAALHYLGTWRWQAGQVKGHLQKQGSTPHEFLTQIQSSIAIAADTKLSLQAPGADIPKRTKAAQQAIAAVTGMAGELTAINAVEGGGPPNGK